jgi:glucose-6-phosphate 1-epimerase
MDLASHIDGLNRRFGKKDLARVVAGKGGLPMVQITSAFGAAEIYLHGAHVTRWQPAGADEVIFVSEISEWAAGKAIRGGIPVIFPWFGPKADDAAAPKHGFARLREWRLDALTPLDDGGVTLVCVLESDAATRALWPHRFCAAYRITVGKSLRLELSVFNPGSGALQFEEALHTYFLVGDVERARVHGLVGTAYLDKNDDSREKRQKGDVEFEGPVDRVYLNTTGPAEVIDVAMHRRLRTEKQNSATTVVWNPWEQGAAALADFGNDEWRKMMCVEASNVGGAAIVLEPGEEHSLQVTLSVVRED